MAIIEVLARPVVHERACGDVLRGDEFDRGTRVYTLVVLMAATISVGCKQTDGVTPAHQAAPQDPGRIASVAIDPSADAGGSPRPKPRSTSLVRESKQVVVDGHEETWRLEWRSSPEPDCREAPAMCPCEGFSYGERGDLDVVRARAGMPEQRLNVSPYFIGGEAMLPKWAPIPDDAENEPSEETIESRPLVAIMRFADYDRDGRATEFPLQIGALACGHTQTLLVGISKTRPELHALGSRQAPHVPLVLEHFDDWAKVLASPKTTLGQWACGDHGSPEEISVELRAVSGRLSARTIVRSCPDE